MSPSLSYGVVYTCLILCLDLARSMFEKLDGGDKSKYQMAIESTIAILDQLRPRLNTRLIVIVYSFGGAISRVIEPTLLKDIDSAKLPGLLHKPQGMTPMGECIVKALDETQAMMAKYKAEGYQFTAPLLSLVTDGEATDDMTEANARMDELLGHKPRQKVVLIPVGIGNRKEEFEKLVRLAEKDPAGNEARQIVKPKDFEQYVRLIAGTTLLVNNQKSDSPVRTVDVDLLPLSPVFLN